MRRVLLVVFVVRFGATLAVPILALYVAQLGDAPDGLLGTVTGLVFSATALATLLVTPLWGRRGDRSGHERTLAVCVILAGAATLPQAFVTATAGLYVLRFVAGSFVAGLFPTAYALAAVTSSREKRGGAHGLTFSSIGLANALGYATGGVIAGWIGIRGLFVLSAVLMMGAGLLALGTGRRHVAAPPESP
jgi:DHA1 family multidrug resistance protein-like MFS transporter